MSFKAPQFLDTALEAIETHQILSWVGLIASFGTGIFTALNHSVWWTTGSWLLVLVIGALIGWSLTRRFHPIRCLESDEEFQLTGVRGALSVTKSTGKFVFKKEQESFTFGLRFLTGQITQESFSYRFLGRHGERSDTAPTRSFVAGAISTVNRPDGRYFYVTLPVPAKPNDQYEITRSYTATDSFAEDTEEVGKCVFYRCKLLKLKVIFTGCQPTNVVGFITKDYSRVAGKHITLEPRHENNGDYVVEWHCLNVEPGERYTVQWGWV